MTDLQVSLIALGCAIVAGVFFYNKWHEYRAKKSVERAFSSTHDDVLMTPSDTRSSVSAQPAQRAEPKFSDESDVDPPPDNNASLIPETVPRAEAFHPEAASPETEAIQPAAQSVKTLPIDELIDCIIPISLEGPQRGEKLLQAFQSLRHAGSKPVHIVGQNTDGHWEPVAYGGAYVMLFASVQLANRIGPLNEIEYSELVSQLRQIADSFGAELEVPDMPNVMTSARALHQFVSAYDAQLSVSVRSNGAPWAISTLLGALERQGFDLRPDGRLVMPDGEGGALFSLSTNVTMSAETTSLLTLLLNVPCVAPERDGFGAMIACARMLSTRLDGTTVDDSGQPLDDAALAAISGQVATFYQEMESAYIPAGSVRALRLFG